MALSPGTAIGQEITELENKLQTVSGKEKVDILNQLGSFYSNSNPNKSIHFCNQAITLSKKINYKKGGANALIFKSYAFWVSGKREKAFEYSKKAITIFENLNDKKGIGDALNTIGFYYLKSDSFNIAQEYFIKSLKIFEKLGSTSDIVTCYWQLGNLYINLEDFNNALTYFQNALKILKESGNEKRMSIFFHSIGIVYQDLGKYNKSLEYFKNALKIFRDDGRKFWIAACLSNMGTVYRSLNENNKALDCLFQSKTLREKIGNKEGICFNLLYIGDTYLKMKNYKKALSFYRQAVNIAKKINDNSIMEKIYKSCSELYRTQGNYKKAFEYYRQYSETKDHLVNEKKNKQIAELQEQYNAEKRAAEIEMLKKDNKIQKITRNAFVISFILVALILILLLKNYLYLFSFWKKHKYISQYRIMEIIGTGGMGTVYQAHSLKDKNEIVAVKVIKEELMKDENNKTRFKREGTIIDKLNHPNIVNIYERGEYKEKLYLVMEYLQGKTLAQKIENEGKIDIKECIHIMKQMTDALVLIHSKNIIHRDLKPANIILIEKDGDPNFVKLLDFGVARMEFQTRLTRTGFLVGTINYMAPEQITDKLYCFAGDVYSLGIIFYEMAVGHHAFQGDTITDVVEQILDRTPVEPIHFRSEIPKELSRLIMQMLSKKPDQRPIAEVVLASLEGLPPIS